MKQQNLLPINPDGIPIAVHWHSMVIGSSVFIPAINMARLIKQMKKEAKRRGMHLVHIERIESRKLGVRFWRVL